MILQGPKMGSKEMLNLYNSVRILKPKSLNPRP